MKRKTIITICSSAAHYRQALEVAGQLKKLGFQVKVPKTAIIMKRTGNFDVNHYKTWYEKKEDYHKKTALMNAHFKKVLASDAILVTNFEKNGMPGYIGGNALMEMLVAYLNKIPIYILNPISEKLPIAEEVYGLNSIFINGDLEKIR